MPQMGLRCTSGRCDLPAVPSVDPPPARRQAAHAGRTPSRHAVSARFRETDSAYT
jgi:hypothetical protein